MNSDTFDLINNSKDIFIKSRSNFATVSESIAMRFISLLAIHLPRKLTALGIALEASLLQQWLPIKHDCGRRDDQCVVDVVVAGVKTMICYLHQSTELSCD